VTFGQLRTFAALARTGSVRAAAAELVVTQPAVSAAVAALERELACELVARDGRGLRLTEQGQTLARYASELLALADEARREVAGAAGLRLAAVTTAGEYLAPPLVKAFAARHPDVELSLLVGNRAQVLGALERREVDVALGGTPPHGHGIEGRAFLRYRLVVVAGAGAAPPDLADATWLLREPGSGTRATVEAYLADAGIAPRATMTLGSNGAVKQAAAIGLGVTLVATHAAGPELASGALRRVPAPGAPLRRAWFVLRRASGPRPAAADAFWRFCLAREARAAVLRAVRPPSPVKDSA
jgi:LysR family transcriptional regulator, low CO2-responsive transcriptional regulator